MSAGVRRILLDESPGERRGVVLLDGRPEHLFIDRDGEPPRALLGMRLVGRIGAVAGGRAFVRLPFGPEGVLRVGDPAPSEGASVEVEVAAEAYGDKGPRLTRVGPAEGGPRRLVDPPSLTARLQASAPAAEIEIGAAAREAADLAEETALAVEHRFRGGLTLAVEPVRALTAIDIDLAAGEGAGAKRLREANLSALRHAARLLRLKALGGAVVIDLLGFPPASERGLLRAEAERAFAVDGPEATVSAPDRFGLLALSLPRRRRPLAADLQDAEGRPSARTLAQGLVRDLLREGAAQPGARLVAVCAPAVAEALAPLMPQIGPRFGVRAVAGERVQAHVAPA